MNIEAFREGCSDHLKQEPGQKRTLNPKIFVCFLNPKIFVCLLSLELPVDNIKGEQTLVGPGGNLCVSPSAGAIWGSWLNLEIFRLKFSVFPRNTVCWVFSQKGKNNEKQVVSKEGKVREGISVRNWDLAWQDLTPALAGVSFLRPWSPAVGTWWWHLLVRSHSAGPAPPGILVYP